MPGTHLTTQQAALWRQRKLTASELPGIAAHLAECEDCRRMTAPTNAVAALTAALELSADHLTYEEMESLVTGRADAADRVSAENHLAACAVCTAEVVDLREFAASLVPPSGKPHSWAMSRWVWASGAGVAVAATLFLILNVSRTTAPPQHPATEQESAAVFDSGRKIWIDKAGALHGIVPPETLRAEITAAIREGTLPVAAVASLAGKRDILLGTPVSAPKLRVQAPVATVVADTNPVFHWEAGQNATRFVVKVYTQDFEEALVSPELQVPEWTASTGLKPGVTYAWTVTAVVDGKRVTAPAAPEPEARFRVANGHELAALNEARALGSDIAVAVAASRMGMYQEAHQALLRLGPGETTTRLLATLTELMKK